MPLTPPDPALPPFERLVALMKTLRGPDGCPWDAKQTHKSLLPYLIEETYELVEAIESEKPSEMRDELGDFLVQFVFHAMLAEEAGEFTIDDSVRAVTDKLIHRHPHVFGDVTKPSEAEGVRDLWERQKLRAMGADGTERRLLDGVPKSMPALTRAFRFGEKAGGVGFDWPDVESILEKVDEELAELRVEIKSGNKEKQTEEVGDLLFVIASLARKLEINPEDALRKSLGKFHARFAYIEEKVSSSGKSWDNFTLDELEAWWQQAKGAR